MLLHSMVMANMAGIVLIGFMKVREPHLLVHPVSEFLSSFWLPARSARRVLGGAERASEPEIELDPLWLRSFLRSMIQGFFELPLRRVRHRPATPASIPVPV